MGKLHNALLSGSTGRTGSVVVVKIDNIEIIRSRPKKSTKEISPKRKLTLLRMQWASKFVSVYTSFANQYFGERSGLKSRYNFAIKNVLDASILEYDTMSLRRNYAQIQFAKGPLAPIMVTSVTSNIASSVSIQWIDNSDDSKTLATDSINILYYTDTEDKPKFLQNIALRKDGKSDIPLLNKYQGLTLHLWICTSSDSSGKASDSEYLGTVKIL